MKLVLATGCFDILHVGHLYYLEEAKKHGDHLLVGIPADEYVRKGPGRPVFSQNERAKLLRALRVVDRVIVYREEIPFGLIDLMRPEVYVKGKEYEGRLPEQELVEYYGGKVVFADTPVYSSTKLVEHL